MNTNELAKMEQVIEEVKKIKNKLNSGQSITQEEARLLTVNDWIYVNKKHEVMSVKQLKY